MRRDGDGTAGDGIGRGKHQISGRGLDLTKEGKIFVDWEERFRALAMAIWTEVLLEDGRKSLRMDGSSSSEWTDFFPSRSVRPLFGRPDF